MASTRERIAVVGAGFAGLAAAERLVAGGREAVVFEARERVGGRVWSVELPGGGLVERGGEFITGGYDATEATAARLGIELDGMGINYPHRELRPGPGPEPAALLAAAERVAAGAKSAAPWTAADTVLDGAAADAEARDVLAVRLQSALAHPFDALDARFLLHLPYLAASAETRRLRGGNQRLATALADRLSDPVRTATAVREIHWSDRTIRLLGEGLDLEADACIVAIPLSLIPELRFVPSLRARQIHAITAIPTSRAAKLALPLREPVAPRALMSAPDQFWAWTTQTDGVGGRIANAWAGAEPVLDALGVAEGPDRWLGALRELWPELGAADGDALLTDWRSDPWARGAYSVLPDVPDPIGDAAAAAPAPNLLFAGEHTAEPEWTGTMEGALRSGFAAAERLLAN